MTNNQIILATKKLDRSFIIFSNTTSQSDCLSYQSIQLLMIDNKEITLIVPKKACADGHHITLYVFENEKYLKNLKSMPNDKSILKCWVINGIINFYEGIDENLAEITLKLNEFLNESLNRYISDIEIKQEHVSNIFNRYRR